MVIGQNNKIPWFCLEDLQFFKNKTKNHPILMGNNTFKSLPRILPDRLHCVLTKDTSNVSTDSRVLFFNDFEKMINFAQNYDPEIFIIGGNSLFCAALNTYADRLFVNVIGIDVEPNEHTVFFPKIDKGLYILDKSEKIETNQFDLMSYQYTKINQSSNY